ncbi:MAG: hypothetical protein KatS3mg124_0780 [Porticoccaceae bacterium]|nr:MAG: hypothetical protein KatS3mg124_0780 [Porticoccaceae bacterium]
MSDGGGRVVSLAARARRAVGEVILVGAGPGDPELITVKGARALARAEAVVYDSLVDPALLELAPPQAARFFVGKRKGRHAASQEAIGRLLVRLARQGLTVVRLKGGDPLVFGRGGEELDCLVAAGIPWQVVPGVTAATACAAAAGIPLTHRDWAAGVTFLTAHRREGALALPWELACHPEQTVAFYMGLSVAAELARALMARGRRPETPVAVIARASRPEERILIATLGTLEEELARARLESPALILVGEVVRARSARAFALTTEAAAAPAPPPRRGGRRSGCPAAG